MSNNLNKEQLLILQDNLSFNAYEKFMNLFEKADMLPNDTEEFTDKIILLMKEHEYWGEIHGWGPKRFYKRITKHKVNIIMTFGNFKGKSSEDFIGWMNRSRYHDMLSGFTDEDMLLVAESTQEDQLYEMIEYMKTDSYWGIIGVYEGKRIYEHIPKDESEQIYILEFATNYNTDLDIKSALEHMTGHFYGGMDKEMNTPGSDGLPVDDNHEVPMSTRWLNDNEGW